MDSQDSFSFWKNLILVVLFFLVTPIALGTSLFSLIAISQTQNSHQILISEELPNFFDHPSSGVKVFASLPSSFPSISGQVEAGDARPEIIKQYLKEYNSPLEPHAQTIVEASDKYGLDYRLLTAIAQQESNLCKKAPEKSYNCWGWGIHSRGTLRFDSYDKAIWVVAKGLKEEYIDKGYTTPEEIMKKYTPLSKGSWAYGVNLFMSQLE
jgi:hypothetical protein